MGSHKNDPPNCPINAWYVCSALRGSVMCDPFVTPWTVALQAPLSMEFSRQEYWSGFPFPSPGDLPDPGTELTSLVSPALAARFFTTAPPGKNTHYSLWDHVSNYIGVRIGEFKFLEFTTFLCPN